MFLDGLSLVDCFILCFNGLHKNPPSEWTCQMKGYVPRNRNPTNQFLFKKKSKCDFVCVCVYVLHVNQTQNVSDKFYEMQWLISDKSQYQNLP